MSFTQKMQILTLERMYHRLNFTLGHYIHSLEVANNEPNATAVKGCKSEKGVAIFTRTISLRSKQVRRQN